MTAATSRINHFGKIEGPSYLECRYAKSKCCGMRCSKQVYNDYVKKLEKVEVDLVDEMDFVHWFRRLQMHGFALTILTSA